MPLLMHLCVGVSMARGGSPSVAVMVLLSHGPNAACHVKSVCFTLPVCMPWDLLLGWGMGKEGDLFIMMICVISPKALPFGPPGLKLSGRLWMASTLLPT